jgi:hypothetical protein
MTTIPILPERSCGECSECCKGWLSGEAHGEVFHPGKPCFFLQGTCGIYEHRPESPCKTYKCVWLSEPTLPLWMRPDKVKSIVTEREVDGIKFWDVVECGETLKAEVLSWLVVWALREEGNLQYRINGGPHKIGQQDFLDADT